MGSLDVELFDQDKPETVRNFLLYARSGAYSNSFLHRCVPGFIVQGGGFSVTNPMGTNRFSAYLEVTNYGRLTNEFLVGPRLSNTFGTLAMAKVSGDTNSASSQWFFNLANNSTNLDTQNGGFTVFGRIMESTNANQGTSVLQHFNTLSTTNGSIVNLGDLISSAYNVFGSLPVAYTSTPRRAPANQELYYVHISLLNQTNVTGLSPPSISIVSPGPDSRFTNETVIVQGTAQDDAEVARVVYRLEGGSFPEIAAGTTNWRFAVAPRHGFNTFSVESIDWDGNRSTNAAALTFLYIVQVPLSLQKIGQGSIQGLTDGQFLEWGRFYTVTAKPAGGWPFGGWTGSVTSANPTLTFQVPTNATNFTLTAKFPGNPFVSRTGKYHGLFRARLLPNPTNSGFMTLTLQTNGLFNGTILHRGGTYTYTGQFDRSGNASLQGTVGGVSRFISLQLDTTDTAGVITGSLDGGATEMRLERLASALPQVNAPPTGSYTFALPDISTNPPSQLKPGGYGFGTASLAGDGRLILSGRLADGRVFTNSSRMTRSRHWPVYVNLFNGRGALVGWLSSSTNQPNNLDGSLQWVKTANSPDATYPAGFATSVAFLGSSYRQPAKDTRVLNWVHGLARTQGADLLVAVTNLVKLTTGNALVPAEPNPSSLSLSLDPGTGLVQGSFIDHWAGVSKTLRGVVLPRTDSILGQFTDGTQVGSLNLQVAPFLVTQSVVNLPAFAAALSEGGLLRFESDGVINIINSLPVKYPTALDANGHTIVVDGGGATRLFDISTNVNFSAKGIVFANGRHIGTSGADADPHGGDACGASILNLGGVVGLTNCVLTNFVVIGGRAATNASSLGSGGRAFGAAICNRGGKVTLQGCQLADNYAEGGWSASNIVSSPLWTSPGVALGAALYSQGAECEVLETTFLRNRVQGGEASLSSSSDAAGGAIAISSGRLRARLSQFGSNIAEGGGTIASMVSGGSGHGGALFVVTNAEVTVDQSTFDHNVAQAGVTSAFSLGGSPLGPSAFPSARGGAVASGGKLVLNACTFNDNLAEAGAASAGGAIYAEIGSLTATNSTWAFNRASAGTNSQVNATNALGGALMLVSNTTTLVNITVAFNSAFSLQPSAFSFGGGIASLSATVALRNSILASNAPVNLFGGAIDGGYNLSSDDTADFTAATSRTRIDPRLGPLTANGGPTYTMAILPNSPPHDAITNNFPAVDQRGEFRPQGARGDIGAFEYKQTLPSFVNTPLGGTVRVGTNFTFQASAIGPTPIGFFWLKDGSPLIGRGVLTASAGNATLALTNIQISDGGSYAAVATNSNGAVTSLVATLIVDAYPVLRTEPRDVAVAPGGSTNFFVVVDGPALQYLWTHNGVPLPGATNAMLTISNALPAAQGTYQVVATNFAGSVTSHVARLTFNALALSIASQPQDLTVAAGASARFEVLASGVLAPVSYQWFFALTPIPNATNQELTLPSASLTNAGSYRVVVTNAYLSVTSRSAVLTVITPPVLSIAVASTNLLITCRGDPARPHRLLCATNLGPGEVWTPVATNALSALGSITWPRPFPTNTPAYYRAASP